MPFSEPGEALAIILKNCPHVPHWPQLPGRSAAEGFVLQGIAPLLASGLVKTSETGVRFEEREEVAAPLLAAFYERYLSTQEKLKNGENVANLLTEWALPREAAAGFYAFLDRCRTLSPDAIIHLKGQIAGPVTIALQVKGPDGLSALYDEKSRDVLTKALALQAAWQTTTLAAAFPRPIVFVDEPGLGVYGRSTHLAVSRGMIHTALEEVLAAIHDAGGLTGIHCCDAIDWTLLFETATDYVSFDAYTYGSTLFPYARELARFLERGGRVAWGIVPTSHLAMHETATSLMERLRKLWAELAAAGVPAMPLEKGSLLTPACGTGTLPLALAERVYDLLGEMSTRMTSRFSDRTE